MNRDYRQDWIVGICDTGADGIAFVRLFGTEEEAKQKLFEMIMEEREENEKSEWSFSVFDFGTDSVEELQEDDKSVGGWYGFNCYDDRHTDFTMIPFAEINFRK